MTNPDWRNTGLAALGIGLLLALSGCSSGKDRSGAASAAAAAPRLALSPEARVKALAARARAVGASAPSALDVHAAGATGYCTSNGGSTQFENITNVTLTPLRDGTMVARAEIYIANPTNCVSGNPCPVYDDSPEYLNVWIDWNQDGVWDASEKVMDEALTGYTSIGYKGTMVALSTFVAPMIPTDPAWIRANLGWAHDPNDPCEESWTWGNVFDRDYIFPQPQLVIASALGVGNPGDVPQTDNVVSLGAEIQPPTGYVVTACGWQNMYGAGDGTVSTDAANDKATCSYEYLPSPGVGPDPATYGQKDALITVTYANKTNPAAVATVTFPHAFRVFFSRTGDDDFNALPNWFEYWKANGAVAGLARTDVTYDPTKGAGSYGAYNPGTDLIELGPAAAETHYGPSGLVVPSSTSPACPGGTFGPAFGIDSVAEVIGHEGRHKTISHNWDLGGLWHPSAGVFDADSDDADHPVKNDPSGAVPSDDLPDAYELAHGTSATAVDSCNLALYKSPVYAIYGDNEFDALVAGNGLTGDAANDWANPGKQSPLTYGDEGSFAASAAAGAADLVTTSGAAQPVVIAAPVRFADVTGLGRIVGNYSDAGVDLDGDGLFDRLGVSLDVETAYADTYDVVVWLADRDGANFVWASATGAFTPGARRVTVLFDGLLVRKAPTDGPWYVSQVELRAGADGLLADAQSNVYATAAYARTAFDPPRIAFDGTFADVRLDTNGDGLFEKLRVDVGLAVDVAGRYTVLADLASATRKVTSAFVSPTLARGAQTASLSFDGTKLFQNGEDGPFYLRALRVQDTGGVRDAVQAPYATAAHSYVQFQHTGTVIARDSYAQASLDVDGDGIIDYLRFTFDVATNQPGTYQLLATLQDGAGATISTQQRELLLSAGAWQMVVDFPGGDVRKHGVDGPYRLGPLTLLAKSGAVADAQPLALLTPAYAVTEFGPPLVALTGAYSDAPNDSNGDGRYEVLNLGVDVMPGYGGVVKLRGRLVDPQGREVGWAEVYEPVTKGVAKTIALPFAGGMIFRSGLDGPYTLTSLLAYNTVDPEQYVYQADAHTTGPLGHRQFRSAEATDGVPPTTTASVTPPPAASGWNRSDVTVTLTATDDPGGEEVQEIVVAATGAQPLPETTVRGSTVTLPPITADGVTTITYFAADAAGNLETPKTLLVRIDRTGPVVTCVATPGVLWPPDHALVPVHVDVTVKDALSGAAGAVLVSATSSEPDDGVGDGSTKGDIQSFALGTFDTDGLLRAERSGPGNDRVYSLRYEGRDEAGNTGACVVTVTVPHDQGK